MKTTMELPDDLFKEVKMRAVIDGRKLKDTVADLLRIGLNGAPVSTTPVPKTLPIVNARPLKPAEDYVPPQEMLADPSRWLKEAELQIEIEQFETASGR